MPDCNKCGSAAQVCDWCEATACAKCDYPCVEPSCDRVFCGDDIPHNCENCSAVMCPKHQCVCACLNKLCCNCTEVVDVEYSSMEYSCPNCRR